MGVPEIVARLPDIGPDGGVEGVDPARQRPVDRLDPTEIPIGKSTLQSAETDIGISDSGFYRMRSLLVRMKTRSSVSPMMAAIQSAGE